MKTVIFLMALTASFFCQESKMNLAKAAQSKFYLQQIDAEKILGQTAKLTEKSTEKLEKVTKFRCTYTANKIDPKTKKTGNLYYFLEEYENQNLSQKKYDEILSQNRNMPGLKELKAVGQEAFLHFDNENFVLIVSVKDNKILRLKVNKITSLTSISELKSVSKKITESL